MDWFLYDKDLHHERVKSNHREVTCYNCYSCYFQSVTFLRVTFSRGQSMVNACSIDTRTTEAVVHRCSESFSKESCKIYSKECLVELLKYSPSQTFTVEALANVEFFL